MVKVGDFIFPIWGMKKPGLMAQSYSASYKSLTHNKIMPFAATWTDLESVILSEVSQTEKEKYHMASLICGIWKEMI